MTASAVDPPLTGHDQARAIVEAVEGVVLGRRGAVELTVAAILSGGHVLVEDVPGSGKTTLAQALAHALGGEFRRIQGTADLMPSDITGSSVWDPALASFTFVPGALFGNVILVDELNRASPRTQSALLEAMDEGTVTVDGTRHVLPDPFVLLATQNPFEQWGTYPLPEGQLDRFTVLIDPGPNTEDVERRIVRDQLAGPTVNAIRPILAVADVVALRHATRQVHVADSVIGYAVAVVGATRTHPRVAIGASTRATIALVRCAQARALLHDRPHVIPDDIKQLAGPVLSHRLSLSGTVSDRGEATAVVAEVLEQTPAPLSGA